MPTLLIPDRSDAERDAVAAAWQARGWPICRLARFWEPPYLDPIDVRLHGDITFCLFLAEKLGLALVSPPDDLLLQVHPLWLGRAMASISLTQARSHAFPCFIKSLTAKLFRSDVYRSASDLVCETHGLADDTEVLVSPPIEITAEVRCLILNGAVTSASVYEGDSDITEALSFAKEFADQHVVATTYILDIGKIVGHGWAVIEANAVWGGGLNGCDPNAMVDCLEVACSFRNGI